jgi:hypothetical protein
MGLSTYVDLRNMGLPWKKKLIDKYHISFNCVNTDTLYKKGHNREMSKARSHKVQIK